MEIGLETAPLGHLTGELNRSYDTEGNQLNLGETCLSLFSESSISGFSPSAKLLHEIPFSVRKLLFLIMF